MADNQEKKSFYALNLTEGRMFGVFIGIVLVLVAVFFAIMVTAFKLSKPKSGPINIRTETIEKKEGTNQNTENAFFAPLHGKRTDAYVGTVSKAVKGECSIMRNSFICNVDLGKNF